MALHSEEVAMELWRKDLLATFYGLKISNIVEYLGAKKRTIVVHFVHHL